jgi:hypothetical protein
MGPEAKSGPFVLHDRFTYLRPGLFGAPTPAASPRLAAIRRGATYFVEALVSDPGAQ